MHCDKQAQYISAGMILKENNIAARNIIIILSIFHQKEKLITENVNGMAVRECNFPPHLIDCYR